MLVDLSLSAQNVLLLIPMTAVLSFLLVFVGPWMYSKMTEAMFFFGGAQMDPRGPGGAKHMPALRRQERANHRTRTPHGTDDMQVHMVT